MSRLWLVASLVVAALVAWRLLARRARRARRPEQALLLHLVLGPAEAEPARRMQALAGTLRQALQRRGEGEVEVPLGEGRHFVLSLYGPNAHRLLEIARPLLAREPLAPGSHAVCRRGEPGAPEERVELG